MAAVVVFRLSALVILCALLFFWKKTVLVASLSATSVSSENDSLTVSELNPKNLAIQTTQASDNGEVKSVKRNSTSYLFLSTENLTVCQDAQSGLDFTTDGIVIHVDYKVAPGNASLSKEERQCPIRVSVPAGQVVYFLSVEMSMPCETSSLRVVDQGNSAVLVSSCGVRKTLRDIFSFSHHVTMELKYVVVTSFSLRCDVTAAPPSARPQLVVHFTSPTKGYIQTPGWNGTAFYPVLMDSWLDLEVPKSHMIMLSVPHLDIDAKSIKCDTDKLTVFTSPARTPLWTLCSVFSQDPVTTQTSKLHVRFVSDFQTSGTGFRLVFSFHQPLTLPSKISWNKWNCSGTHWSDFQQHFPCDLESQCLGGEDELDCPYTARGCGLGAVSTRGKCYFYVIANHTVSWYDASTDCLTRGATLVSLNTPEEWRDVMSFLQLRRGMRAYIGLQSSTFTESHFYKRSWQWADGTMAYFVKIFGMTRRPACATLRRFENDPVVDLPTLRLGACDEQGFVHYMCEAQEEAALPVPLKDKSFMVSGSRLAVRRVPNVTLQQCPEGHVTRDFLSCDLHTACWGKGYASAYACAAPMTPLPPMYECGNELERVPFALACDHRRDCSDGTDEDFCVFLSCTLDKPRNCGNQQCISLYEWCDGQEQCVNQADEQLCYGEKMEDTASLPPPAVLDFVSNGTFVVRPVSVTQSASGNETQCPGTHFRCPGEVDYYCLPVYLRCNKAFDCPGREDEVACDTYACPGLYRCRDSNVCLQVSDVCDGVYHCPQRDDELACAVSCPENCTCYGLAFFCSDAALLEPFADLRFLRIRGVGVSLGNLRNNLMLVYLDLAQCNLTHLEAVRLPNLQILDLSRNRLTSVSGEFLTSLQNLRQLFLSNNPLTYPFFSGIFSHSLHILDLSGVQVTKLDSNTLAGFPHLRHLNFSNSGVEFVLGEGFKPFKELRFLDMRGCRAIAFPSDVFSGLVRLQTVYADNFKLCCPATLPADFNVQNCQAPSDHLSSCDALLRSPLYRVSLASFATLAIVGNMFALAYRLLLHKKNDLGYDVFVTNLCVSDFLMGLYLAVVGVADRVYMGAYFRHESDWKASVVCKFAGFASFLSSEVSALLVCLITVDRVLVLRFPFSTLRFRKWSAQVACAVTWVAGALLALVPLLPVTSHWQFYARTGMCVPLLVTRDNSAVYDYTFSILIVLNFFLFFAIAAGQAAIFWSVRVNSMSAADSTKKGTDLTLARRLITIAMFDFACWFPIGLTGFMTSNGVSVSSDVHVTLAIFVLPLKPALNPFIYTINVVMEKRRQEKEDRRRKNLLAQAKVRDASARPVQR